VNPQRIGVYGGTFDPPHLGHLILAETAADQLDLARVLFVPAADPPHKSDADMRSTADRRLALVQHAIAGNPRFAVSRVDMDRPGPHYSVDMLRLLRQEWPDAELFFLLGADSLRDLPTWSRPAELIALAALGVMPRPGVNLDIDALARTIPGVRERIHWLETPLIGLSASTIAARVAAGLSIRYQVPDAVCLYIEQNGLYSDYEPTNTPKL
jgi:nicotinate-nucleotide adenylyltransferase